MPFFDLLTRQQNTRGSWGCQRTRVARRLPALVLLAAVGAASCGPPPEPRNPTATAAAELRGQAREALDRGDARLAVATFRRALQLAPSDADTWNDLGLAYQVAGDLDSAQASFESAIRLAPRRAPAHLNLAVLLMRRGVSGRARTEFAQALELDPGNPSPYWNFATALLDVGKTEPARELLDNALQLDPACGPAEAAYGRLEALNGQPALAIPHFERAESLGVQGATLQANLGLALLEVGRAAEAEVRLDRAVALDSTSASAWNHLGLARLGTGKVAEAIEALERARRLAPRDEDLRFNLGSALLRLERYAEAVALLERPRPERADLLALAAMALRGAGRRGDALLFAKDAAARAPRDVVILNNYGVLLAETGDVESALDVWRQVLEVDPGNTTARDNLKARGGVAPQSEEAGGGSKPRP